MLGARFFSVGEAYVHYCAPQLQSPVLGGRSEGESCLSIRKFRLFLEIFAILQAFCQSLEEEFLKNDLKLELHPQKIILRKLSWGIDFLGYIVLPHYILPRTKTKRRIFRKIGDKIGSPNLNLSMQSYLGYLSHADTFKVTEELKNLTFFKDEF